MECLRCSTFQLYRLNGITAEVLCGNSDSISKAEVINAALGRRLNFLYLTPEYVEVDRDLLKQLQPGGLFFTTVLFKLWDCWLLTRHIASLNGDMIFVLHTGS